jgi:carboxymethylenebutenolidase
MCYDIDALPPEIPPSILASFAAGDAMQGSASHELITLTSADGTPFAAYQVHPASPNSAAIVILPDVRGLFRFYEELAERFASVGIEAIAIDYFGRTAGVSERAADFDYMSHVAQTQREQISADVGAAVARLRQDPAVKAIFTVGFCFGGANSLHQAAEHHGLSGVIGFYGSPTSTRRGTPTPIERIKDFECPVLAFYGGADQGIPVEDVQQFDQALSAAGLEHEVIIYPGAPHSFFDRTFDHYQQESADAWQHMLSFISGHTPRATV